MPPYEPNFYIPENIVGYTGVLNKNPTVYFLSKTHYGHITQVHDDWTNVGRELVCPNASYGFGNYDGERLFEMDTARGMQHTSRSPITLVGSGTPPPELTHAIMVHSEKKARQLTSEGVKTKVGTENLARRDNPGQAPTDEEREGLQGPVVGFWWTRAAPIKIPNGTRLYVISQAI
jgi:hypothetical protein